LLELSQKEKIIEEKIIDRLSKCKTEVIGFYVSEKDYIKNKRDPLGYPVKNSCNIYFCPNCQRRVVFKKQLDMFQKFRRLRYVYHHTFSPEKEFWEYGDPKFVKKALLRAYSDFFGDEDYGIILGVHYHGDKNDNFQCRMHFHVLITSSKKISTGSHTDKFLRYTNDELFIIDSFKGYLKRSRKFNWDLRLKNRSNFRNPDFVYFHTKDISNEKNIMNIVAYLSKYLSFGNKQIVRDKLPEYIRYYVRYKMNIVTYAGIFRKGRKIINVRNKPEQEPRYCRFTHKKLKFLSNYYLDCHDIKPVDIYYYYYYYLPNIETEFTRFLKEVSVS